METCKFNIPETQLFGLQTKKKTNKKKPKLLDCNQIPNCSVYKATEKQIVENVK